MGINRLEILVWSALTLALLLGVLKVRGPGMADDTFQYLSEARHIGAGDGWQTSLVHWDTERAHGRIPAPAMHFPPGYPLAVAAAEKLGIAGEAAGVAVSAAAAVLLIPLIAVCAAGLGLGAGATRGVLCLAVFNWVALQYGTTILSEAAFALASLGSMAALIKGEEPALKGKAVDGRWLAVSGLLAGGAYWTRYAGVFLVGALALYHLWRMAADHSGRPGRVAAVLASGAAMAPILVRNLIYAGTWTGGATRAVHNSAGQAAAALAYSLLHTVMGPKRSAWGAGEVLMAAGLAAMAWAAAAAYRDGRKLSIRAISPALAALLVYAAVYTAGFFYLAIHSEIEAQPRKFYPLVAVFALLAGGAYQLAAKCIQGRGARRLLAAGAMAGIAGYAVANAGNLGQAQVSLTQPLMERLGQEVEPGVTARQWIQSHIPREATIMASCGQRVGYLLDRKTVSLISRQYTAAEWNEPNTRAIMQRFQADWLILYPDDPCEDVTDWPYLRSLAAGDPAQGLPVEARSGGIVIRERER